MKPVTFLLLALWLCSLGVLAYQHHRQAAAYERQNQAIALVQKQYDAALRENQALKSASRLAGDSRVAFSQAQAIAARYQRVYRAQGPSSAH
jgi:cell division protein FtsB